MLEKPDVTMYSTDASFSWNGYNYQGKVGLLVALKKIEELRAKEEDLGDYYLELEWLEDFSIKKNNDYITIHQVKTYNSTTISTYKDAIWALLAKILEFTDIEKAYLHSTSSLIIPEDFLEKQGIKKPSNPAKNPRIKSPYECYRLVVDSNKYGELCEKLDLYNYGDKKSEKRFCSFDEIETIIKMMIKSITGTAASEERINRTYLCLLSLVDANIKERHKAIQEGGGEEKVNINFADIMEILDKNHELPSREYTIYYLKDEFQRIASQYIVEVLENEYNMQYLSQENFDLFKQTIGEIYNLDDNEFYEFCLKISPDNEVTAEDENNALKFLTSCLPKQGLENCFFEILKQIRMKLESKKWVFNKRLSNHKNVVYLPSTILDDNSQFKNEMVIRRIQNNDNPDLLREVEKIITKNITISSIDDSRIYRNIPDPDDENQEKLEDEYHDRITIMKRISLIKLEEAKEELE
ncbi:ABC-three component system protein [Enterococcus casseliflavus]|uniref:ABC-three component system protein n=1 Tax=Enterococcus casseliflavus TaxID=37734 RepID=UPI0023D887C3|nr:ABC-three component system protein [Enterococcus casseliflavus]WEI92481.1 hypothetical protein PZY29_00580 [Enterococcus casseliflavus]